MPDTPQARPLALQLWTIRDELAADQARALRRVAELGFRAVEPIGVGDARLASGERIARATRLRELLDDNGLTVCAAHGRLPAADSELDEMLDELAVLGTGCLVAAAPGAVEGCADALSSVDGVRRLAERLTTCADRAAPRGVAIGYHNHSHEFAPLADGRLPYEVLWRNAGPEVVAEVDVYWVAAAGQEPAAVIAGLGDRARLLHLKDGPADPAQPQTVLGQGAVDIEGLLSASERTAGPGAPRWHVIELDGYPTDPLAAAAEGARWLVERGWSRWEVAA
jgi:sugar phosphate isomerase/epimerase